MAQGTVNDTVGYIIYISDSLRKFLRKRKSVQRKCICKKNYLGGRKGIPNTGTGLMYSWTTRPCEGFPGESFLLDFPKKEKENINVLMSRLIILSGKR